MDDDHHQIVRRGYDEVADAYAERFGVSTVRQRWLLQLLDRLPPSGGRILDLGCGNGLPAARALVERGHRVVGVDASAEQVRRARQNLPQATFVEADMCELTFERESFDAVCAFYAMTHVLPRRQLKLISDISDWLKPNGLLIATFGVGPAAEWIGEWLGTTMYFGHVGESEALASLGAANLSIEATRVERQDNEAADFLWVLARKFPGGA